MRYTVGNVPTIRVTDPDDPRIAAFRDVRERDVAGRLHGFIAEGEVVLRVLARTRLYRARSLLIAAQRIERLRPLIDSFGPDVETYAAAQAVMDQIAGFPIHRGILAFGERAPAVAAGTLLAGLPAHATVLALFGIANHDNMGGLFRNAAAFGAAAVLLDPTCCDPLYRKAIRVSTGSALTLPFARFAAGVDPVALLTAQGFETLALSPAGTTRLSELTPSTRTAILLGAEGPGLPKEILERARTISIPMAPGVDSLNVASTSGIVLHHLADARRRG